MMTKRHAQARAAVESWCKRQRWKLTSRPRHIFPAAYVLGYAAPRCLIVLCPWTDAEPHMRDFTKQAGVQFVREFDPSLKAGDWCITAYVCRAGIQEHISMPIPTKGLLNG